MAGAVFGEVTVMLECNFSEGGIGEVAVSLFVAGAVVGELWNESRRAKCCIFQYKMCLRQSAKRNLECPAGCGLPGSCSDQGRICSGVVC